MSLRPTHTQLAIVATVCGAIGLGLLWPVQAHEGHDAEAANEQNEHAHVDDKVEQASPSKIVLPGVVIVDACRDLRIVAGQDGVLEAPVGGFALPGQKVHAGQVLARLRPTIPQSERRDLSVDYAAAHREALLTRLQVNRYKLDGSQPFDIKLATPTLQLLADYRSAQIREAQLKRALNSDVAVIAPRDAVVVRSSARAGQSIVAGQALFELNLQGGLAVSVDYSDSKIDNSQFKQALTTDHQSLELKLIGQSYDPELRLNRAFYAISDSGNQLLAGEPVQVALGNGQ